MVSILGGRYKIVSRLGAGGFGETYLAEDMQLPDHQRCVVKHFKPQFDDPESLKIARRLFDTEAKVLHKLGSHDQIPRLLANFEEDGQFYLVQELIEGHSFDRELISGHKWRESEAIALLQDILTTLAFVHQQKVIHRDLKPDNLIRRQRDRKLVLIDFGAVKEIQTRLSTLEPAKTVSVGTSGYMPSEQAKGLPQYSSDIYALGIIIIQTLTGLDPDCLHSDPVTLEIAWQDGIIVNPKLAKIINKMVKYDCRQRYLSATEALEDINKLTTTNSIHSANFVDTQFSSQSTELAPSPSNAPTLVQPNPKTLPKSRLDTKTYQPSPQRSSVPILWMILGGIAILGGLTVWGINTLTKNPTLPAIASPPVPKVLTSQDLLVQGQKLDSNGQHQEAIAIYEQVIKLNAGDVKAWKAKAESLMEINDYRQALLTYNEALKLDDQDEEIWQGKGNALAKLKLYRPAIAAYDQAIKLKPDFAEAIGSRALVVNALGSRVVAIKPKITPPSPGPSPVIQPSVAASTLPTPTLTQTPESLPQQPSRPRGRPNLAIVAKKLNITEERLLEALGSEPPNLAIAAQRLGIKMDDLRQLLDDSMSQSTP